MKPNALARSACGVVVVALLATLFACANGRAASGEWRPVVRSGFDVAIVTHIKGARGLAISRDGTLFVGTLGNDVEVVSNAEGTASEARTFASIGDAPAAGVALADGALYVGTEHGIWKVPYRTGDRAATSPPQQIATVRSSSGAGAHRTTSVAIAEHQLFASVGSSCNACQETDTTRASILAMSLEGRNVHPVAVHIRNAIALASDATTGTVWAGVAGQDELEHGHPYEIFDAVTQQTGTADYGWPNCYENRRAATPGYDCSRTAVPRVVFPAYETPTGAAIYPLHASGAHAFPPAYRGGAFVALHGSWHQPLVAPRVAFVPLRGDAPAIPVDWNDPARQWSTFADGFQHEDGSRMGRPSGVAVGPEGSLFVADDEAGVVYRIRPSKRNADR